jgi:hypothetical protein
MNLGLAMRVARVFQIEILDEVACVREMFRRLIAAQEIGDAFQADNDKRA